MVKVVKKGGKIVTIVGMPTLENIRMIGGTACILSLVIAKREKRKEFKAAAAAGASWDHLFLSPSGADLQKLANELAEGTIKPVIDNVWDFTNGDEKEGWRGAFTQQFSGRSKGKCVVKML